MELLLPNKVWPLKSADGPQSNTKAPRTIYEVRQRKDFQGKERPKNMLIYTQKSRELDVNTIHIKQIQQSQWSSHTPAQSKAEYQDGSP